MDLKAFLLKPNWQKTGLFAASMLVLLYLSAGYICGGSARGSGYCGWLNPLDSTTWQRMIDNQIQNYSYMLRSLGAYPEFMFQNVSYLMRPFVWLAISYLLACVLDFYLQKKPAQHQKRKK